MPPRLIAICASLLLTASLRADFSFKQTARMTGGVLMNIAGMMGGKTGGGKLTEPMSSTVAVHGDKLTNVMASTRYIIDLSAHTITSVDLDKKTYSVITFDEMTKNLEGASDQMSPNKVKVDIQDGPGTRTVIGKLTHEKILTLAFRMKTPAGTGDPGEMKIRSDVFYSADVPGSQELRDFYKRMANVTWSPGSVPAMGQPGISRAMAQMMKSYQSIEGVPLYSVTAISGAMTGMPTMPKSDGGSDALMEITTEVSSYSTDPVDPALFVVPQGYAKVDWPTSQQVRSR